MPKRDLWTAGVGADVLIGCEMGMEVSILAGSGNRLSANTQLRRMVDLGDLVIVPVSRPASNLPGPPQPRHALACETWQYRVTAGADVVDATKTPIARASSGQTFYRSLDPTVQKAPYRYCGTLGYGGPAGYVLQEKLQFVQEICGPRWAQYGSEGWGFEYLRAHPADLGVCRTAGLHPGCASL
ncbi:hypothetical protein I6A60_29010 [Frankia sp. AgB1.9]|uniref:hypothetical protein n=1 Tax=unclassified Frankia TaxID=2632575 RepID=UPI0019336ACA|nr:MULTISPECIES: hypothetical protein [unclassified Frankia]MBL7492320.1 hypothetical protein [Frankia sp. AgW1.1]MBL7551870.1 hypothetical protein [Frankia sp. AgB1.9]MBL7625550.1 hypothetical protein [Frankia sp. AgB1.8]